MGFQEGLSGLNAASKNLDVIGNNVANSSTVGFKSARAEFADVYASAIAGSAAASGIGVNVVGVTQQFGQGDPSTTGNPLDIAINGTGFFVLSDNGAISYTRDGEFQLDSSNYIETSTGARLQGYGVNSSGNIINSAPGDLQISTAAVAASATTKETMVAALNSGASTITSTFSPTDSTTYNDATGITAYDSLGNGHAIQLYFTKTASNTWSVYGSENGTQIGTGALGTVTFDSSGAISSTSPTMPFSVSVATTNGSTSPMTFSLDMTGTTQTATTFGVTSQTQDGYASGKLVSYAIGTDGTITGRYSNSQTRTLGQIAMASFANEQGLAPIGNNQWQQTASSGQPIIGAPGSGNLGSLQSEAVESSNVDLTAQLVDMITAQRDYQANAQTIKTEDAIMQTMVNLQ